MKSQKFYIQVFLNLMGICAVFSFNVKGQNSVIKTGDMAIIVKDSVPLRSEPSDQAPIDKYIFAGSQLKITKISDDKKWYKIKTSEIGAVERKIFKLGKDISFSKKNKQELNKEHAYWIFHNDVYTEPKNTHSEVYLNLSVYEKEDLQNAIKINYENYINNYTSLNLDEKYFIGSRSSANPPFSISALIYKPGRYYLYAPDELESTDAKNKKELENRYKFLYENGTLTPFYRIQSDNKIDSLNEKLICTKLIMNRDGCYPDRYIGTEIEILNDTTYIINNTKFLSSLPLNTDFLFNTNLNGVVYRLKFLYILEVDYANRQDETIVRCLRVSWIKCM